MQIGRKNAAVGSGAVAFARLQDQRARAVAEENAGSPVGPVHQPAEGFGADDQHAARCPRDDQSIGIGQGKDEAGADRLHVKGKAARHAKLGLDHRRGRRKGQIGGRGGDDDGVNVARRQPRIGQRRLRRPRAQIRSGLPLGGEMAAFDARAAANPFVRRIDQRHEFTVGHHTLGQVMPDALDHGAYCHSSDPASPALAGASCPARSADATRAASD